MVRKSGRPSQRGGKRLGQQGQSYANRVDLNQPVRTATGQPYGEAGRQAAAQKAIPLPGQGHGMGAQGGPRPGPNTGDTGRINPTPPGPQRPMGRGVDYTIDQRIALWQKRVDEQGVTQPGGHGPLDAPTNRPAEPLTAGLPTGAGPGPEAIQGPQALSPLDQVRAIYAADPNEDMRRLLAYLDQ